MPTRDTVENGTRTRRGKSHAPRANGQTNEFSEFVRLGRALPRKVRKEMSIRPEVVLVAVGGGAFLAGAILGSRLGRALLSAAIPIGLERLVTAELGPRLLSYAKEMWSDVDGEASES
jgi:hypothetical protein